MTEVLKSPDKDTLQAFAPDREVRMVFPERSELAVEIIGRKPDFFDRWAVVTFLVLLLLLIGATWFIKYPDVINASAVLGGSNAPKEIVARQTGKLTALFFKNNQQVKQGDVIGWIESSANTSEVLELSARLGEADKLTSGNNSQQLIRLLERKFENLGELQSSYQVFVAAWQKYNDHVVNGFYTRKKTQLNTDIAALREMVVKLSEQKKITTQDNQLAMSSFEMNETLYHDNVISAEEYRKAKSGLLNKLKSDPQIDISIISQQLQISAKQKEIDQLEHDISEQQQTFEQALQTLKSQVNEWESKYTVKAPASGSVVYTLPLQTDQFIEQGKLLGYVNPADSKYHLEIKLAQQNMGKVDTGMKVQLRFEAYPYQEIGTVSGTLDYLSNMAIDSAFLGTVRLDKGLWSNFNKPIPYKPGLKAQAMIITKDMRLLQRIYYSIVKSASMND